MGRGPHVASTPPAGQGSRGRRPLVAPTSHQLLFTYFPGTFPALVSAVERCPSCFVLHSFLLLISSPTQVSQCWAIPGPLGAAARERNSTGQASASARQGEPAFNLSILQSQSFNLSIFQSFSLSISQSFDPSIFQSSNLSVFQPLNRLILRSLSFNPSIFQSFNLSIFRSFNPSFLQSFNLSTLQSSFNLSILQSLSLSVFQSFDPSIFRSFILSVLQSLNPSISQSFEPSIFRSFKGGFGRREAPGPSTAATLLGRRTSCHEFFGRI